MNPDDLRDHDQAGDLDEQFFASLTAYDEALAAGLPAREEPPSSGTPIESLRLAQSCLMRLERQWPRSLASLGGLTDGLELSQPTGRFGRFRLQRELGRGGCGVVFLAFDLKLHRQVALKVPRPEVMVTAELRARFIQEAQAAAGLDHPNVVPIYETGQVGPVAYIASTYCAGPTLAAWLKDQTAPVPSGQAAILVAALADGIQHAHDRGVLHRDLKPGNILLVKGDSSIREPMNYPSPLTTHQPKITDFGLAKVLDHGREAIRLGSGEAGETGPTQGDRTHTGTVVGTPRYMAPEQAEGTRAVGRAADVYALGVILYELLAGRAPFLGLTDLATLRMVLTDEPVPPHRLRSDLPADLEAVCLKCLEKEPARRYGSAALLAEDLRRFLAGLPTQARPVGTAGRTLKWARRRPTAAALIGVCAMALLGAIVGTAWHALREEKLNIQLAEINAQLLETAQRERDQRVRAEQRERQLRRTVYVDQLQHAAQAQEKGHPGQAAEWLDSLRPQPGQDDLRGFEWYYLKGLCHPLQAVWRGHQRPVCCLAVSPDGKTVASGGYDRTVRLWDVGTGKERAVLNGHRDCVDSLAFSPDGRILASVSDNGKHTEVKLWAVATGTLQMNLQHASTGFARLAFAPDSQILVVSTITHISFWDTATGQEKNSLVVNESHLTSLAFAPDGKSIATGLSNGIVKVLDAQDGQPRMVLPGHAQLVSTVVFSPDGSLLASGSKDCTVKVWSLSAGELRATLGHGHAIRSLAFSPDGHTLASAAHANEQPVEEGEVKWWDVATGNPLAVFDRHVGSVNSLAFLPAGRQLALAGEDKTIKLIDTGPSPGTVVVPGHAPKETWALAFAPDGRTLASGGDDHQVRLWDVNTGRPGPILEGHDSLVTAVAYSPDGRLLVSGSFDPQARVKLWDLATGKNRTLTGAQDKVYCVAISPDGRVVAAGGRDQTVRLWRTDTGQELAPLTGHEKGVRAVTFSRDGRTFASSCCDGKIRLWDTSTWRLRCHLDDTDEVRCLAFAPDDTSLASGNRAGIVRVWDLATGQERACLRGHVKDVYAVAFTPHGRTLASAGEDQTIRLWQAGTGAELLVLKGHGTRVNALAFAPDGRSLASASHDGAIRLWRTVAREAATR